MVLCDKGDTDMMLPTATFRVQLRNGMTFARLAAQVHAIAGYGFSHLYLSPILAATEGSTHGYDVTDPTEIDPSLGGEEGFRHLAKAAQEAGLGIILDIVPNHMAFSLQNRWLVDTLRHGADSRYARYFDVDWSRRLVLPWLPEPFETMRSDGRIAIEDGMMVADEVRVPLALTPDGDVAAVHDAQPWQLTHWIRERDGISHRRFFNVTDLIGVRVEDAEVFEATHVRIFDLIDAGLVQGLRLDHVDGLADPGGYLRQLRARVGDIPIWVEKILTGDEALPDWPVEGTTGYEAARQIARSLTDPEGHARLLAGWQDATGETRTFHAMVEDAKQQVLREELAAELHDLIALGRDVRRGVGSDHGDEAVREAVIALLVAFPRYRTYFTDGQERAEDRALMDGVANEAAQPLRSRAVVDLLAQAVTAPSSDVDAAFRTRFQQVTGALVAKSHEDTAAFRHSAFLAACEVGADPDAATLDVAAFARWCQDRAVTEMTLTSTHDTKRSEDARARLLAMSHLPEAALALIDGARARDGAQDVGAADLWYVVQSALAIWGPGDDALSDRLCEHLVKAQREAKLATNWTYPDEAAEQPVLDLARATLAAWASDRPESLDLLVCKGEVLSLIQIALKLVMPGVPDVYQGCLVPYFALTDPDNRRAVAFPAPEPESVAEGFPAIKLRLTTELLHLRRDHPEFFRTASFGIETDGGVWRLRRMAGDRTLTLTLDTATMDPAKAVDWSFAPCGDRAESHDGTGLHLGPSAAAS